MAHHGNTPAAWTGVLIILVGFVLGGIGLIVDNWWVFWIGVALWPIALIVGTVMARMGMGSDPVHSSDHR
jgi:type IV secretory pathway TrbD component